MADNKNLPVKRNPDPAPAPRPEYAPSPVRGQSLMWRAVSRFIARLNTATIEANAEEVRAHRAYIDEKGKLADQMLDTDRKIANYLDHRDDILADDHQVHIDRMEEAAHQRELNRRRREATLRSLDAHAIDEARQRGHGERMAELNNERDFAQAEWEAERAKWGRDAFAQSMPFRKARIEHLYAEGALDKEIARLITEGMRDQQRRENAREAPSSDAGPSRDATLAMIDQLIAETDQEIELARATHAPDEALTYLYAMRSRLSAKRATAKGE